MTLFEIPTLKTSQTIPRLITEIPYLRNYLKQFLDQGERIEPKLKFFKYFKVRPEIHNT